MYNFQQSNFSFELMQQLYRKTRDKDAFVHRSIYFMCKQFGTEYSDDFSFSASAHANDRKESAQSVEKNPSVIKLSLDELAPAENKERLGPSEPPEVDKGTLQALGLSPGTMFQVVAIAENKYTFAEVSVNQDKRRVFKAVAKKEAKILKLARRQPQQ